jgi:hypothetical protein
MACCRSLHLLLVIACAAAHWHRRRDRRIRVTSAARTGHALRLQPASKLQGGKTSLISSERPGGLVRTQLPPILPLRCCSATLPPPPHPSLTFAFVTRPVGATLRTISCREGVKNFSTTCSPTYSTTFQPRKPPASKMLPTSHCFAFQDCQYNQFTKPAPRG